MKNLVIAVDGPAGAGKTSVVAEIGKRLGYNVVNTGRFYRALAYWIRNNDYSVCEAVRSLDSLKLDVSWNSPMEQVITLNGEILDNEVLGAEDIGKLASDISALPEVREWLLDVQRNTSKCGNIILEGRDIGTVVFPDADIKIFLTANPLVRAYRRFKQLEKSGIKADPKQVFDDLIKRDYNDSNREYAPLKKAEDAILVDTSDMRFDDVISKILEIITERLEILK